MNYKEWIIIFGIFYRYVNSGDHSQVIRRSLHIDKIHKIKFIHVKLV